MSDSLSPAVLRTVHRATTQPVPPIRRERLTPPCQACNLPLVKTETRCPRCGAEVLP